MDTQGALRGLCFDLFNTLVSVGSVPEEVGRYTADILGLDRQAWNEVCFGPHHEICQPSSHLENIRILAHSLEPAIPMHLIELAAEERQRRFDHALINIPPVILEGLQKLRSLGLPMGLISNASSSEVQAWDQSPLADYFDTVTFSWSAGLKKPDDQIYTQTADSLGLSTNQCLFVGDGGSDEHFGAHSAGMKPVLITHFMKPGEQTAKQDRYQNVLSAVVDDLEEIYRRWREFDSPVFVEV